MWDPPKDLESDSHYQEHQFFVPLLQAEADCQQVEYSTLLWLGGFVLTVSVCLCLCPPPDFEIDCVN